MACDIEETSFIFHTYSVFLTFFSKTVADNISAIVTMLWNLIPLLNLCISVLAEILY